MDFEKRVQKRINGSAAGRGDGPARRQPNSGALWGRPGDIVTPDLLVECKERGTKIRGEKSYTITREQLEKTAEEAILAAKPDWFLVFGFRNDPKMYVIRDFDSELRLLEEVRDLREQLIQLQTKDQEE